MSKRWLSNGGIVLFLAAVFCAGFMFFYHRMQRTQALQADTAAASKSLINKPLPDAQLLDLNGVKVDEQVFRKGRVILIFVTTDCDACVAESRFLQTILGRRSDVSFYGLLPFGTSPESTQVAKTMFPFPVFYDEDNSFVRTMGINRVPVKVFLEDGIIKKGWIGAAITDQAKHSFLEWFDNLP